MSTTPASPTPLPIPDYGTLVSRAIAASQVIAKAHNDTVVTNYEYLLLRIKDANDRGFPTPIPPPPMLWVVNEDQIAQNITQGLDVFPYSLIPYVHVSPPVVQPVDQLRLGPPDPEIPGFFTMTGDSNLIAPGTVHVESGHQYRKTPNGRHTMFSQFGDGLGYGWQQIS